MILKIKINSHWIVQVTLMNIWKVSKPKLRHITSCCTKISFQNWILHHYFKYWYHSLPQNNINLLSIYCLNYLNNISINQVIFSVCYRSRKIWVENNCVFYCRDLFSLITFCHNFLPTLCFHKCDLTSTYLVCNCFLFLENSHRDNWQSWHL